MELIIIIKVLSHSFTMHLPMSSVDGAGCCGFSELDLVLNKIIGD